jgi:hypothetical protein
MSAVDWRKDGKQVLRPFSRSTNPEQTPDSSGLNCDSVVLEEDLVPLGYPDTMGRFPIFQEDMSPLIQDNMSSPQRPSPPSALPEPATITSPSPDHLTRSHTSYTPAISSEVDFRTASPVENENVTSFLDSLSATITLGNANDLVNPLDRPSSPSSIVGLNPFLDPVSADTQPTSAPLSRTSSSRTLSLQDEEETNSMSDWTDAFADQTESEFGSDVDTVSESDVASDAESELSWARIRTGSRPVGFN